MTDFPEIMSIWTPDYVRDFPNTVCEHGAMAAARIEALEAENARLRKALFDAFDNIDAGLYDEASAILRNGITGSRVARDDSEAAFDKEPPHDP